MMVARHDAHVAAWINNAAKGFARKPLTEGFKPQALHTYVNADGMPLYWRIRLKHPDPEIGKWIRPMRREGNGFVLLEPKFEKGEKPLYALDRIARNPSAEVWIVEGEQKADALAKLGLLATTSGSATSADGMDWKPLQGRTIRIWPDNDDPGKAYANEVAGVLADMACSVSRVDVDKLGLGNGEDVMQWLEANASATASDVESLPLVFQAGMADASQSGSQLMSNEIQRLAMLNSLEYEKVRVSEATKLGVRVGALDGEVATAKKSRQADSGKASLFPEIEEWHEAIEADQLLKEIHSTIKRFVVCENETAIAATLWIAFTWFIDVVEVAPLAIITAPEKRCGKTQLLNLIGRLSRRPLVASNISPAATYRVIEAHCPTLLIDEADSFLKDNEELRGVINSGHTRQSAYVIRTVGDDHTPQQFSTWGAKAISGIGHLSETLMDRGVILELRRKLPSESVQRLRHAESGLFDQLASKLARFADETSLAIGQARPDLPNELNDRAQDNWEPLLAIADCAGGDWPRIARDAALKLSGSEQEAVSLSAELLLDIQEVFDKKKVDRISTADLIQALIDDDLKPWATYNRGKAISPRQLAKRLSEYNIQARTIRIGYGTSKGFLRALFDDAFRRYLTPSPWLPELSVTPSQKSEISDKSATSSVTSNRSCAVTGIFDDTSKPAPILGCDGVTAKTLVSGSGNGEHAKPSKLRI